MANEWRLILKMCGIEYIEALCSRSFIIEEKAVYIGTSLDGRLMAYGHLHPDGFGMGDIAMRPLKLSGFLFSGFVSEDQGDIVIITGTTEQPLSSTGIGILQWLFSFLTIHSNTSLDTLKQLYTYTWEHPHSMSEEIESDCPESIRRLLFE